MSRGHPKWRVFEIVGSLGGLLMGNATAVTGENFDTEVLQSKEPVLVDFWAAWCGPCRAIASAVEEIAAEQRGKLKVVKLDVDENVEVSARYGVQSIPTLLLFKDGQPVERLVGAYPKRAILSKIQRHLEPS
jgi:thioredoxin 1